MEKLVVLPCLVAASTTSIHNKHEQSTIKWRIFATLPQLIRWWHMCWSNKCWWGQFLLKCGWYDLWVLIASGWQSCSLLCSLFCCFLLVVAAPCHWLLAASSCLTHCAFIRHCFLLVLVSSSTSCWGWRSSHNGNPIGQFSQSSFLATAIDHDMLWFNDHEQHDVAASLSCSLSNPWCCYPRCWLADSVLLVMADASSSSSSS